MYFHVCDLGMTEDNVEAKKRINFDAKM